MALKDLDKLAKSDTEHAHQRAFFAWLNAARLGGFPFACDVQPVDNPIRVDPKRPIWPELALFHAVPNGGLRDKITAAKLKAEGAKAGVLDTFLPVPKPYRYPNLEAEGEWLTAWYMGLYIEFKEPCRKNHKNGGLSDAQIEFGDMVREQGYCTRVAYTWREAANLVMLYYGVDTRVATS